MSVKSSYSESFRMSNIQLKILFVVSRMPSTLTSADRVRAFYLIKGLVDKGYKVDLLSFEDQNSTLSDTDIYSICHKVCTVDFANIELNSQSRIKQVMDMGVGFLYGYPRRVWQFHSRRMRNAFVEMVTTTNYDVVHFSELGVAELAWIKHSQIPKTKIFDLIDAVSLSVQSSLKHRIDLTWPARLIETYTLRQFEIKLVKTVTAGIVVSPRDKAYLNNLPNLHVIPMGVPNLARPEERNKDIDLIFVGNMSTKPNIDAIMWFVQSVMPIIWAVRPQTNLYIVGWNPTPEVRQLANDRITITGSVPDSNAYINRAKVFIAPMRMGAGQKTKLLEAFANSVPVVATHEANEGTEAHDNCSIILCSDPPMMAKSAIRLLEDEKLQTKIGENGYKFMKANFTWERSVDMLENLYNRVLYI